MDKSVVIAGGEGWVEVEKCIRRIKGNGKNTIKIKYFLKRKEKIRGWVFFLKEPNGASRNAKQHVQ